jgi:hypothetical protein
MPTTIETTRVDEYMHANGLDSVDLLKIDIEGHEVAAITGLGEFLASSKPTFLVEVLTEESGAAVWRLLAPLGYQAYRILDNEGLEAVSAVGGRKGRDRNYLVCQPDVFAKAGLSALAT